ncbi:hypothetical protein APV28_0665 [Comamonas testosteroni]|nr:hypothetical protein APV28_0665 [Comamonas testosteroni]
MLARWGRASTGKPGTVVSRTRGKTAAPGQTIKYIAYSATPSMN